MGSGATGGVRGRQWDHPLDRAGPALCAPAMASRAAGRAPCGARWRSRGIYGLSRAFLSCVGWMSYLRIFTSRAHAASMRRRWPPVAWFRFALNARNAAGHPDGTGPRLPRLRMETRREVDEEDG